MTRDAGVGTRIGFRYPIRQNKIIANVTPTCTWTWIPEYEWVQVSDAAIELRTRMPESHLVAANIESMSLHLKVKFKLRSDTGGY